MTVVSSDKRIPQVSTRFELEKNIIKILLLYGHEEVEFEEPILQADETSGDLKTISSKVKSRVFEKIYLDLQQDEIDFTTTAFKSLYPKILNALSGQGEMKMDSFVTSLPAELATEVSDLLLQDEQYTLHDWERKNIFVADKSKSLPKWVHEIILRFRCQLIDEKVSTLQEQTEEDQEAHHKELLEEIVQYHKLKTLLSGRLNRVV
jgi:DNA primase